MSALSISQAFQLFAWFPLAVLLFFLLLIARFYEKFSGARTWSRLFSLPVILFGAAVVRSASIENGGGDVLANLFSALGGLMVLVLITRLYARMMAGRAQLERFE